MREQKAVLAKAKARAARKKIVRSPGLLSLRHFLFSRAATSFGFISALRERPSILISRLSRWIWIIALVFSACSTTNSTSKTLAKSFRSDGDQQTYSLVRIPILTSPPDIPSRVLIECAIDDVEHVLLKLDTAAPKTSMPPSELSALGLSPGVHDIWLGNKASGVHVGRRFISSISAARRGAITGSGIPSGTILRGTAGTDLLQGFAIGLDFQGRSLWVIPRPDSTSFEISHIPRPSNVGKAIPIPAELKNVDPTEGGVLFVNASFEAGGKSGSFLVDTGTNTILALSSYWSQVHSASSRSVPLDLADYQGTVISGAYRMGSAFSLGEQIISKSIPVWVLDRFPALAYEGQHFHHAIDGIIGLWGIYENYAVLDYGPSNSASDVRPRLFLFPYLKAASLEESYFTGFGVTVHRDHMIVRVAKGSDAERKGVRDGDVLVSVSGSPYQLAANGVIPGSSGEVRSFKLKRRNKSYVVKLKAERLLRP